MEIIRTHLKYFPNLGNNLQVPVFSICNSLYFQNFTAKVHFFGDTQIFLHFNVNFKVGSQIRCLEYENVHVQSEIASS